MYRRSLRAPFDCLSSLLEWLRVDSFEAGLQEKSMVARW
jgi:hypothetical protein